VPNSFDLAQFVAAQDPVMPRVLQELRVGRKQSHWMWFVFPQLLGLGQSVMSRRYGMPSLAEARAYVAHPVLGDRLVDCTNLVMQAAPLSAHAIFGSPDDLKFQSSMTLFDLARPGTCFSAALDQFFQGKADAKTLALLG
jgi:uncharacterized protein (DUF1810 family)